MKQPDQWRSGRNQIQFLPKPQPPPFTSDDDDYDGSCASKKLSGPKLATPYAMSAAFPPPSRPPPAQRFQAPAADKKSYGGAVRAIPSPEGQPKEYQIQIKNKQFIPSYLRVEKGAKVTWKVCQDNIESDYNSLYYERARSHVIAFDEIYIESPKLELASPSHPQANNTFSHQFTAEGSFSYSCCIYTRMRGTIEVFDAADHRAKPVPYVYAQG